MDLEGQAQEDNELDNNSKYNQSY